MFWNLNVDNFTLTDRLRVAWFILNKKNRLTMGEKVEQLEEEFGKIAESRALFVSSGSTANSLLVETYKELLPDYSTVIVPTTTWSTSVNPWIQAGYDIRFSDVNLADFSFDLDKLSELLRAEFLLDKHVIVFATSLIGFVPNIDALQTLCDRYQAILLFDNCENTLGQYHGKSLLSYADNTTSTYFGHQLCSVEGGFFFTKHEPMYTTAKMIRNHGLTRALGTSFAEAKAKTEYEGKYDNIDPQFLFAKVGNNFRNTEINALFGLLDLKRKDRYIKDRRLVYQYFFEQIDHNRYYVPSIEDEVRLHVPFCLPIICDDPSDLTRLKRELNRTGIEYRPIVGGNLLIQPIYSKYADGVDCENSKILHERGLYVGLHSKVSYSNINLLCEITNNL